MINRNPGAGRSQRRRRPSYRDTRIGPAKAGAASPVFPPGRSRRALPCVPAACRPAGAHPAWLAWHGGAAVKLAQSVYEERELPSGHLDAARLAVLADMLEEAGCSDAQLLGHLRGPGPHVRGCFAVDAMLGKQ